MSRRYIVLGMARDIEHWRKGRGLDWRDITAITPGRDPGSSLRGLTGHYALVVLDSWRRYATVADVEALEEALEIVCAKGGTITRE